MKAHGMMFHHFFDEGKHIKGQGAVNEEEFERILDFYAERYRLLSAEEWMEKALRGTLKENEVCITFDDALLCQYDVAVPVLRRRRLTAFFFIYTSPYLGIEEKLEIYRHFRTLEYQDIDQFYREFFELAVQRQQEFGLEIERELTEYDAAQYRPECPYYTDADRMFRHLRDDILRKERYDSLMDMLMQKRGYDIKKNRELLWIGRTELKNLQNEGNVIGLHSHTHSTVTGNMSYEEQLEEYGTNKKVLEEILGKRVETVSYPCNSYNKNTLRVMKELDIQVGFCADMTERKRSILEMPREDHANILIQMRNEKRDDQEAEGTDE